MNAPIVPRIKNGPAKISKQINSSIPTKNIIRKNVASVSHGMKIMFLYDLSCSLLANIKGTMPRIVGMINKYVIDANVAFSPKVKRVNSP